MKLHFKPMPWLTVVTAICLAILISLGTWQYHRLQWKTALLAEIDVAAVAAPFTSFADVLTTLEDGGPIDFRRINLKARYVPIEAPYHVYKSTNKGIYWNQFIPFREGQDVGFVNIGEVTDANKQLPIVYPTSPMEFGGYVRKARKRSWMQTKSTPEKNRWFSFNSLPETHDWGKGLRGDVETRFYIDASDRVESAEALLPKRPEIANNHFDYMLTWYSFAVILLIIYFILHRRAGRLILS